MILLDSHAVVWLLTAPERLSARAHNAILQARAAGETLGYSPVSLYEIAYAARRKRLQLASTTEEFIAAVESRLEFVPLTSEIVVCAAELPDPFHGDPLDRIIVATAIVHGCSLITHDGEIRRASVCKTLW
ncbi:MAG TPA: type II toxin-antitoxin system VapC family toxin [Terracidiphilus sp.]|nr:type II toxin-antitoxin system VapC family toxin [Terracidiphilus sp.]